MQVSSVAEQLLFTTVRIETNYPDGRTGVGTGFIFSLNRAGNTYLFLVTNKHVVVGTSTGVLSFTTGRNGQPLLGQRYAIRISDFEQIWTGHPDSEVDVAVAPLVPILEHISGEQVEVFFRAVDAELAPDQTTIESLDALEDVVFIGYP